MSTVLTKYPTCDEILGQKMKQNDHLPCQINQMVQSICKHIVI